MNTQKPSLLSARIPKLSSNKGFTLFEILIVVGIVVGLVALVVPQVVDRLNRSRVSTTKIGINNLISTLNIYSTECGKFPTNLQEMISTNESCPSWVPDPSMKKLPKDAWGRDFLFSSDGSTFTIRSLGQDGKEGGTGFAKDISSDEI